MTTSPNNDTRKDMATIGFLGLGTMGKAMASRLVEAGHDVVVWNRSQGPVDDMVALGARAASSPAEALATGASFSMLANDQAAEAVLSAEHFSQGSGFHANMASVSPDCGARLAAVAKEAGIAYIGSPVLGRPAVAAAGKLNILAGGDPETIAQAEPFYSVMGVRTWPMGERPELANLVKVAANYNIIHALQALAESIALVEKNGVDPEAFVDLLSNTFFAGVVYQVYGNLIATREYLPAGFTIDLGLKDLSLAEQAAASSGTSLPTAPVLRQVFEAALADDSLDGFDWAAIAEVTRKHTL
jgi:3-hydroxyisobutyrate dehydrogenase-like beta-hydroxyacid dehydrogenase